MNIHHTRTKIPLSVFLVFSGLACGVFADANPSPGGNVNPSVGGNSVTTIRSASNSIEPSTTGVIQQPRSISMGTAPVRSARMNSAQDNAELPLRSTGNSTGANQGQVGAGRIGGVNTNSGNGAIETVAASPLFAFLAGWASIVGVLLALLYPAQIHGVPPSEYRSMRWGKTVQIVLGVSLVLTASAMVFVAGNIQTFAAARYAGEAADFALMEQGILGWVIVAGAGLIVAVLGVLRDPVGAVLGRLAAYERDIANREQKALDKIAGTVKYEDMPIAHRMQYDQVLNYYASLKRQVTEMMTGTRASGVVFARSGINEGDAISRLIE